jgi:uncharacterized protein
MQYAKARLGRVFLLKFSDGDILIEALEKFSRKERIKAATMVFLGALRSGKLVTGPRKPVIPPKPNWKSFKDGWEAMGIGTIFVNKTGPQIHIHTTMGKKNKVLTGCLRLDSRVFLVIEAIVFELTGIKAAKEIDPRTGLNLLKIYSGHE